MPNLTGKVCLVTGASKGIGRGIALQLISCGATCYITGRDLTTLQDVKGETEERGSSGKCVPVQCDHSNEENTKKVFKKIASEQNGQLDLLVNNAYAAVSHVFGKSDVNFWDQDIAAWDLVNNVGLRNHYICSVYAARMMVPKRKGLIVNISSVGGKLFLFMPPYGIGKAANDRMAKDCAVELEKYNIAFVSLWPGMVQTEFITEFTESGDLGLRNAMKTECKRIKNSSETTEFPGKGIAHMLADKTILKKTGQILLTTDLADEYNFKDVNDKTIMKKTGQILLTTDLQMNTISKMSMEILQSVGEV
ncbi:unnamed protein product [Clavelina lepadiformis]|uniref:Dehydrogenase/reductase SDR family member 1 n=1 Tax=Clavelina lepadiformis TaxID=159417 RepID=A0ABP0F1Q4_CLALP